MEHAAHRVYDPVRDQFLYRHTTCVIRHGNDQTGPMTEVSVKGVRSVPILNAGSVSHCKSTRYRPGVKRLNLNILSCPRGVSVP